MQVWIAFFFAYSVWALKIMIVSEMTWQFIISCEQKKEEEAAQEQGWGDVEMFPPPVSSEQCQPCWGQYCTQRVCNHHHMQWWGLWNPSQQILYQVTEILAVGKENKCWAFHNENN